jgi:hypothetical protein
VGAVVGANYTLHEAMVFSMFAGVASADDLAAATAAAGTNEAPGAKIAYTFGTGNSYGHPMEDAIDKYVAHGWTAQLDRTGRAANQDYDFAIGWEVDAGAPYEGPLRANVDRSAVCGCAGVKQFLAG